MFYMQFIAPHGYPKDDLSYDPAMVQMVSNLKGVDRKKVAVPNSALSIQLLRFADGASVEIDKRGRPAFISFLCFEAKYLDQMFRNVENHYSKYELGTPTRSNKDAWIHLIPIPGPQLRESEIFLCEKMTVALFWRIYATVIVKSNPYN